MDLVLSLITGLLTGLLVAMPPGAVAVITIQRTLCNSRRSGFISGLGAAGANTISATIAVFFLGIVLPFIEAHVDQLKLVCGLGIIILGTNIFLKQKKEIQLQPSDDETLWGYFLSTFFIAVINPAFILTYITFFAFFGIKKEIGYFSGILLVTGILFGASLWWFMLTSWISRLRNKFRPQYLTYLSKISGGIIIILGCVLLAGYFFSY